MTAMSTFDPGRLVMVDIPGQSLDAETAAFLRELARLQHCDPISDA